MNIQPLTIQDIPHSTHLQPEGWGNLATQLLEYVMLDFCRTVKILDHEKIIGTATVIFYKDSAWLAHIIVDPSYRKRGIGLQLVNHLLEVALAHSALSINLIATELGMPVYKKAGFREIGKYDYLKQDQTAVRNNLSTHITAAKKTHYQQMLEMDQHITGENRHALIHPHLNQSIVFLNEGVVQGYYLPTLGQGPIYALSDHAGLELMKLKYNEIDTAVIPRDNPIAIDFLQGNGFAIQEKTLIRMTFGKDTLWQPLHTFSRIGGNYG